MTLDWRRLKAVVLESDDWGLCAWVPDEQAFRALADTAAWRSRPGHAYGRSTLEHADDVARLAAVLLGFRGADGLPAVWQANTVMATPDFDAVRALDFECESLPLLHYPEFPPRWARPGLWDQVERARAAGVWWPELHGLVHLPQGAWLRALRAADPDATRAHAQQCFVCAAVEQSAEYDPAEPVPLRTRSLALAVDAFRARFGRPPGSFCAPDYRWDERLEEDAEALGLTTFQGLAEQAGHPLPRLRHLLLRRRWRPRRGRRFHMPARIAFEPRGSADPEARLGAAAAHRAVRAAWERGQPAVISSHRANYAHLDPAWSEAGRQALGDLLARLAGDRAVVLTDVEVRSLQEQGWSLRPLGGSGALLRSCRPDRATLEFPAPAGVTGAAVREAEGDGVPRLALEGDRLTAEVGPGTWRIEWRRG